ncbi:probable phosphoglycerate mutase [Anaerosphaera aminiphila DSM 21120]|uniref:Probable phosphoglycerate mutase n=1 Tax=Anaerosphaera aminiphila DSM 21120 TaxID=1120995 RepID=A0A1M5QUU7_9FIRM|nr:histidine phosphatase family protein [Anaerosphaera aminiphila]SHH17872.1 probable phosphoglycerate mutase [Anaerosphaera aminiphila DSM 21120]
MKIYFTRHGETVWNSENRIQGHKDSELTEKGIEMGLSLREQAKDISFDKVYSSDLGRAYKTTELIVPNQEIIKTPLLREIDVGNWSGQIFTDIKKKDELYKTYFNSPENYFRDDGESFYDLNDRVREFFENYVFESKDKNILIVSHGITIISIFNLMQNVPIEKFWTNRVRRNGEFNIAKYEYGRFEILKKAPKNPIDTI